MLLDTDVITNHEDFRLFVDWFYSMSTIVA